MNPLDMILSGLQMAGLAYKAARASGLIGQADWTKYVDAGLAIEERIRPIIQQLRTGQRQPGMPDFDNMTADQARAYLAPESWESLEIEARARIAAGA